MNLTMESWIDTHAHVYLPEFNEDRKGVLDRARKAGLTAIYMPNVDDSTVESMLELENSTPDFCHSMIGLHPCSVKSDFKHQLQRIEGYIARHPFKAIGEIGTDLYWDKTFWEEQKEAFTIQATWAAELGLPMSIHCRETLDQTIELLGKLQDGRLLGVFHCFTGTRDQAEAIIALGFMLGIGGVLTFKNSTLREVVRNVNRDSVVLETDSPYLAPVPNRGKRNEPAYVSLVGEHLALAWDLPVVDVQRITTQNALRLFEKDGAR